MTDETKDISRGSTMTSERHQAPRTTTEMPQKGMTYPILWTASPTSGDSMMGGAIHSTTVLT
ncbi:MAG: hypothetical protein GY826_27650 [Fuerstiella sp.]|nr:hypothetical protein [Fuerstiella sp.]